MENKNRKGFEDEKWEQEVRAEIAKKKGTTQTKKLTKEEQAAVSAQRKKESEIRARVQSVHDQLSLGLGICSALVAGNRQEIESSLVPLARILLNIAIAGGGMLVGDRIVEMYLGLAECIDKSLHTIRASIAMATLRANNVTPIPSRWLDEPMGDLVTRILYRLRFITESRPLPSATFGFCFPVLQQVVQQGGIGADSESAMEQVVMALDVIGFHCPQGSSSVLPRKEMITSLLYGIKEYPQCSKNAKSSLVALCESMDEEDLNTEEIEPLFEGLLSDEILVRQAALQGLELLDLTDIDYSPQLWLACHDTNEQNAALASSLWEENAMYVEECYKDQLLQYAGKTHILPWLYSNVLTTETYQYPSRRSCVRRRASPLQML